MKAPPKSPQSSPVKRAKRARLMWLYTNGETGQPVEPWRVSPYKTFSVRPAKPDIPVHVLDASPEAMLARHSAIKVALDIDDGTGAGYDHAAWLVMKALGLVTGTFRQFRLKLIAPPASVYSAPAGKGEIK